MAEDSDDEFTDGNEMFEEPEGFRPPEKPATFANHTMRNGTRLEVRLVGHNPLWGHLLWNAGRTVAEYIEENASNLIKAKTVLELGAGAGLPSLVSALSGASKVVVTDYPDADLIENLKFNVEHCVLDEGSNVKVACEGYLWGSPVEKLKSHLATATASSTTSTSERQSNEEDGGFDVLVLADLLFNHSEHTKLLSTIQMTLRKASLEQGSMSTSSSTPRALVFFTPYRPWLLEKDLAFFPLAEEGGFKVTKLFEKVMDKVMFEDDPGDEKLRRTVFAYELTWKHED